MTTHIGKQSGFTLVEMMISMLVAAVIISPLYVVTKGMAERTTHQKMSVEAMQKARVALATVSTDLSRTGLMTSANPATDPNSVCSYPNANCNAANRRAVVHLNPNLTGQDSILISGSFFDGNTYTATVVGPNTLDIYPQDLATQAACQNGQFDRLYTYLHITGPSGKTFETGITNNNNSLWTGSLCRLITTDTPPSGLGYAPGDVVQVEASHTLLYTTIDVATGTTADDDLARSKLVRCFVPYNGGCPGSPLIGNCQSSVEVVADHVTDFQVWFRPVTPSGTSTAQSPNYHAYSTLGDNISLTMDDVDDLAQRGTNYIFPTGIGTISGTGLECGTTIDQSTTFPPSSVRSAMVRLSVRSTRRSFNHNLGNFGNARIPLLALSGLYEIKTVVTEVVMPNMIGR